MTDADTIRVALNMGDGLGVRVQADYMTPARAALGRLLAARSLHSATSAWARARIGRYALPCHKGVSSVGSYA